MTHVGHYSLIQYVPDPARAEGVNVGVVLLYPEANFLAVRLAKRNDRVRTVFGRDAPGGKTLDRMKDALKRRIERSADTIGSAEALGSFAATLGNALQLTPPRPVRTGKSPGLTLRDLFGELVGHEGVRKRDRAHIPALRDLFRHLAEAGRAKREVTVMIPTVGWERKVPYAYRNGHWNYVIPRLFPSGEGAALKAAKSLAVDGRYLRRSDAGEPRQLVVVSDFHSEDDRERLSGRIERILEDWEVENVRPEERQGYFDRVEREAVALPDTRG